MRSILAKSGSWNFTVPVKSWLAVAADKLVWALAATALYIAIFYVAMWVL